MSFLRSPARSILPVVLGAIALAGILAQSAHLVRAQTVAPAEYDIGNKGLVATGALPASTRDKFGETTISASAMAMDR